LVASVLVAALGTACGSGGTNKDVHPSATEPRGAVASRADATSTSTGIAPTTTITTTTTRTIATVAPARDQDFDGVPSPRVVDRGNDYAAITDSLLLYGRWLDWHHPDGALVTNAYLQGSTLARDIAADLANRRRAGTRVIEVDDGPIQYQVISVFPDSFSVHATERVARRERVDRLGQVLERITPATETYTVAVMRFGPDKPWRVNLLVWPGPPIETQL
jgi:hypothetical protein